MTTAKPGLAGQAKPTVWQLMVPVRARMRGVWLLSALATVFGFAGLLVLAFAVIPALLSGASFWGGLAAFGALTLAGMGLTTLAYRQSHLAAFQLETVLRKRLLAKLSRVSLGEWQVQGVGALTKVIVEDVRELHGFVADTTPSYPRVMLAPPIALLAMFWLDWRLTLAVLVLLAGAMGWIALSARRSADRVRDYARAREEVSGAIVEFLQAMPAVRTFDSGHASFGRYQRAIDRFSDFAAQWYRDVAGSGNLLMVLLNPASLLLVLVLGLWLRAAGAITDQALIAFLLISAALSEAVMPLLFLQSTSQKIAAPIRRIHQLLDLTEPKWGGRPQELRNHELRFEGLCFGYGTKDRALADVSFTAPSGQVTALVGPSGAGKTTLARLIPRFWDAKAGRILIGGVDIRDLPETQLLSMVGFVFQDTFLFSGSIAENICFGAPDASDAEVEAAARIAQAHDFIAALPNGYRTRAGERGIFLSGGQRQRINIARAVLQNRPILVLDEATAFTDPENEAAITRALMGLMRGKTVLMIAHRLQTVRPADNIVVMDGGRVVATGTHDALIAAPGLYADLWHLHEEAQTWAIR